MGKPSDRTQAPTNRPRRPLPQVPVKRESPPSAQNGKRSRLRVFSEAEEDELGIGTLLGDYEEQGVNHGRPTYQKVVDAPSQDEVSVYVYYWDTRDGVDFSGWWFGDKVGGSQVWSRATDNGKAPPERGWKVPWDGDAPDGLLCVEVLNAGMAQPVSTSSPTAPTVPPKAVKAKVQEPDETDKDLLKERIRLAADRVTSAEAETQQAVRAAKDMLAAEDVDEATILEADSQLKAQMETIQAEHKDIAKEVQDARASGSTHGTVGEFARLLPRLRALHASCEKELSTVKLAWAKVRKAAEHAKQQASAAEAAAEAEQKDVLAFQAALPQAMQVVTDAEDAVETVAILAAAVSIDEDVPDAGETQTKAIQDIEKAATKASTNLIEAKKIVQSRLVEIKRYAPEAKKVAMKEYQDLDRKILEASKRLSPLKKFRQDFEQKANAKKALAEITKTLSSAELEVEKAHIMTSSADSTGSKMEEEEISSTSKLLQPAEADLQKSVQMIERRLKALSGNDGEAEQQRKELEELQRRSVETRNKMAGVRTVLKRQEESLQVDVLQNQVSEKVELAEEAFLATSEAEMPFLKGLEVLPREEGIQAVAMCEAAAKKCEVALEQARLLHEKVVNESKTKFSKEVKDRLKEELAKFRLRGEETAKKLASFKKETQQRKAQAMLQEVTEKVAEAESQCQTFSEVVKVLGTENLGQVTVDVLKYAIDQSRAAEKDSVRAYNAAREVITAKQKQVKENSLLSELSKLQSKLAAAHGEMVKSRQLAKNGDAVIRSKKVIETEEARVKSIDEQIEEMEKLAVLFDGPEVKAEDLKNVDETIKKAQAATAGGAASLDAQLKGAAASLKIPLNHLRERVKEANQKIEKVKQTTKAQREKAHAEAYVKEAEQKVEAVEASLQKIAEAELPFLKGIEVLPLKEASTAIADCESAAKQVQEAMDKAKSVLTARVADVHKFAEVASKPTLERLQSLVERNNAAGVKLAAFRKDTEKRKRTSKLQEADEILKTAEEEVDQAREAATPLAAEDLSTMTADTATQICKTLAGLEKAAGQRVHQVINFLAERRKDRDAGGGVPEELEQMQVRLGKVKAKLAESKKHTSMLEQRFVSKKLLAEAAGLVDEVDAEIQKVEAAASPLLDSSSLLVRLNVQRLSTAVQELISKGHTKEALFAKACGEGGTKVSTEQFKAFIAWLAENQTSEDVVFLDSQLEAIFKKLDADSSGDLSEQEFQDIFSEFFLCVQPISMTDGMSISSGKNVLKLDVGMVVEALGMPQFDETQKLTRLHCRVVEDTSKEGWVTMRGNQGKVYLSRQSPQNTALKSFARNWNTVTKQVEKVSSHITDKRKAMGTCAQGPLIEARTELDQLKAKAISFNRRLSDLKRKVEAAKKEYEKKAEQEKKARLDAQEQKLLAAVTKVLDEQVQVVESEATRITEAMAPLVNIQSEVEVLKVPTSLLKEGEQMNAQLKEKLAAVRTAIAKHEGPKDEGSGQIRQAVNSAKWKVDNMEKEAAKVLEAARATASRVADVALREARASLRCECAKKDTTLDAIFDTMRGDAPDGTVSKEAFERYLGSMSDLGLSAEQVSLVYDRIPQSEEGASRWSFLRSFQQFFVCQKSIALTYDFVISNRKPLRMVACDEVMEVLEGPQTDPKLGITRVKGRLLEHNVVGWATVSGNQGSRFLKEKAKPYMQCLLELPLEPDFLTSEAPIRLLKAEEVLEVIEGPRKDSNEPLLRARCKACSDQAEGWLTLKGPAGFLAEQGRHQHYVCKTAIAMTDNQNIKTCKVLRKLEVGEIVRVLEGPEVDKDSSVSRIKAVATKDSLEGWVTVKGNAGTVYAEEAPSLYTVLQEVPLQRSFSTEGAEQIRALAKDEAIEVLEGPKEEVLEPVLRFKGRALADSAVGWVSMSSKKLKSWSPLYRCKQSTVLQSTLATKSAASIRRVDEGEILEVVDGPKEDSEAGLLRIRARARKDQAVGWITMKGNQGTVFLVQSEDPPKRQ